jgi:hypothetical protein
MTDSREQHVNVRLELNHEVRDWRVQL